MSKLIKTSTFSKDDYGPIGSGTEKLYDVVLNKDSSGNFEISNLGPCMNPNGYVSNVDCPESDLLCNCPKDLKPINPEPSDTALKNLKYNTNECNLIKKNLSTKWFGIDYFNPSCSYNCTNIKTGSGYSSGSTSGFTGINQGGDTAADGGGDGEGDAGSPNPKNAPIRLLYKGNPLPSESSTSSSSSSSEGSSSGGLTAGPNFKHYLEYSKTNATFWNTPKETPLYRKAQTALLTYQRIKIVVNGDFSIKPGNLIAINMPTPEMRTISETRFYGRWMVYKNEHIITSQKHSMVLYLMRDGSYHDPNRTYNISTEKTI